MREREVVLEQVDDEGNYVKSLAKERRYYGFWLRFASEHFVPCQKCQEELEKIIEHAEIHLGNKDYEPEIELYQKWNIVEGSWRDLEKRPATEEEKRRLWGGVKHTKG